MNALLTQGLKIVQGDLKVENVSEGVGIELNGKFVMKRGEFQQTCSWYGRMYVTRFGELIIGVDDWELQDITNVKLGELPIDNVHDFKKTLQESGLRTLADSIGFSNDEETKAVFQAIVSHKDFKRNFSKKAILWNALSVDEQKVHELQFVCNNFTTCGDYMKKEVGKHYGIDQGVDPNDADKFVTIIPSLEVCQAKLAELTQ